MHDSDLLALRNGELVIERRLAEASNQVYLAQIQSDPITRVIYKPVRGERELWDFPAHSLSGREVAAFIIDQALGLNMVPPTTWRDDAPYGPGSVQLLIVNNHDNDDDHPVGVSEAAPAASLQIVSLEDRAGNQWVLHHKDDPRLRRIALFDSIINNADRKAGHILVAGDGLFLIDHGVTFHSEPKLRTVLWGWAGEPLNSAEIAWLRQSRADMYAQESNVTRFLSGEEWEATKARFDSLIELARFPVPTDEWPALPWPLF